MAASSDNYQVGKGIVYFRKFTSLPSQWNTGTSYAAGAYVSNGTGLTASLWMTASGGTSANSGVGPTGSTGTFTDNTVSWTQVEWTDMGNAPKFAFSSEVETLEHFSSRSGIKTRDKKVVLSRKGSLSIILDEITQENLDLALMGSTTGNSPNRRTEIFASSQIDAQIRLVGTNDVGKQFDWFFGNVSFQPGKEVSVIGDTWTQIELTGEVNADGFEEYGVVFES